MVLSSLDLASNAHGGSRVKRGPQDGSKLCLLWKWWRDADEPGGLARSEEELNGSSSRRTNTTTNVNVHRGRFLRPQGGFSRRLSLSLAVNKRGAWRRNVSLGRSGWLSVSGSQKRSLIPHNPCNRYRHNVRMKLHRPCHSNNRYNRYDRTLRLNAY